MNKPLDIKFLEFIEPQKSFPEFVVITDFMVNNFEKPDPRDLNHSEEKDEGCKFLKRLDSKKFIVIEGNPYVNFGWEIPVGNELFRRWWDSTTEPVQVKITEQGIEHLYTYRVNHILLETNISTKSTNEAVKKNLTAQLILGIVSAAAIVASVIIAVMDYNKSDSENLILLRKSLQRQNSILQSIQQSQKGMDTSLRIMAKKTLPKKK